MSAKQVPLVELLRLVPSDARYLEIHDPHSTSCHPVGRLMHEAVEEIEALRAQVKELEQRNAQLQGEVVDAAFKTRAAMQGGQVELAGRIAELEAVLRAIRQWDMLDVAADGDYFKKTIDAAMKESDGHTS